ncbi:MAG: hypothetical protein DLM73_05760 [Chthoniobacterales bacterium]|nr:MAG: hypothetical protein DLM73_05760 [Chthoniobacterales bacterium]
MFAFLNERSLEPFCDWEAGLLFFLRAALELRASAPICEIRRDDTFFTNPAFSQRFNHCHFPKDVRALVRQLVFSDRYCATWLPERLSVETDIYECNHPEVELQDESASEAAERKLRNAALEILLFSVADSAFGGVQTVQIKLKAASAAVVSLPNLSNSPDLSRWLSQQHGYYDPDSPAAPRDFQTVLEQAPARFTFTGKLERRFSRCVYLENKTRRFFYVDEGHPGKSAHLEVYSATEDHLGTARIDSGLLDPSTRVKGRKLRW